MTPVEQRLIKKVRHNPLCLEDIPKDKITSAVAFVMIQESPDLETLELIPDELKDHAFYKAYLTSKSLEQDPSRLKHIPKPFHTEDLLIVAMREAGTSIAFADRAQITLEVILAAVKQNPEAIFKVPLDLLTDDVYLGALSSYDGFNIWSEVPEHLKAQHEFQIEAVRAAFRHGLYEEFADEIIARGMSPEIKVEALRFRHQLLEMFPVEERIDLVRGYIRRHDFPWSWFEDSDKEFPEDAKDLFKLAVKEPSIAKQIAILERMEDSSLETLMPMARGPKQKQLLRGIFGTVPVASLLKSADKVKGTWFRDELGI